MAGVYLNCPFCNKWLVMGNYEGRSPRGVLAKYVEFKGRGRIVWTDAGVAPSVFERVCHLFVRKGKEIVAFYEGLLGVAPSEAEATSRAVLPSMIPSLSLGYSHPRFETASEVIAWSSMNHPSL